MTFTIPPGTPKAVKAAAFGRELVKACRSRNVPLKELERVTGVGHTSLDNYRRGLVLPKVEVARALAATLDWPRLASMIAAARTFECARKGCLRTFRNDTGAPRKYCTEMCRRIAENLRQAAARNRRAGQHDARAGVWMSGPRAGEPQLRAALRLADEQAALMDDAIAAMCAGCEPEGVCRTADCPLRPYSPLPLEAHCIGEPRTLDRIRTDSWTPARRERFMAGLQARWADPAEHVAQSERSLRYHAEHPEWADRMRALAARRAGGGAP